MSRSKKSRARGPSAPRVAAKGREKAKAVSPPKVRTIWYLLIAGAVVIMALVIGLFLLKPGEQAQATSYPIQGTQHVTEGESHPAYNSNPPTSGWHYGNAAPWGVQEKELPDEQVVHNLEHGGIWISYRPTVDGETVEKLRALVARYRSKVILTPRAKNDAKIALAAWGRLDVLEAFDERRIVAFIQAFKDRGPEKVPD